MSESRIVDWLASEITELKSYQPFIIYALNWHTVRAVGTSREIVLILVTIAVCDGYGARRELVRIKRVDRMVDGHSKRERRQHRDESNGETAVAAKVEGVCCGGRTERTSHTPSLITNASTFLCPTLGTKQRNRQGEKRENTFTHGGIS